MNPCRPTCRWGYGIWYLLLLVRHMYTEGSSEWHYGIRHCCAFAKILEYVWESHAIQILLELLISLLLSVIACTTFILYLYFYKKLRIWARTEISCNYEILITQEFLTSFFVNGSIAIVRFAMPSLILQNNVFAVFSVC